jgi:adenylate cyclase
MPFVNLNHDPEIEYLADGITESLISSLTQLPRLKVMSRNSVVRYKGREIESAAAGRDLGVEALLLGQIQSRGDVLTISVELVGTQDRRRLWGEQYQRKHSDLLSWQTDVAREVSAKLRPKMSSDEGRVIGPKTGAATPTGSTFRDTSIGMN